MRKLFIAMLFAAASLSAQQISPEFFGQNAWMPDTIGTTVYYGQLHNKWPQIAESGAKIIRFGGIGPDKHMPTKHQYLKMVDKIRAQGMEPMLQVPFYNNTYTAAQAADIVNYINVVKGRNVKYWVVANEPDNEYGYTSSSQCAPYIRAYSYAMKNVDPSIKIIGPETAWYNEPIINGLTTPGGPDDVCGKDNKGRYILDIISFHAYPFNGTQSRAQLLTDLVQPYRFQQNLTALNQKVDAINQHHGRTGADALSIAVTEANVGYINNANDNLNGTGANSFVGGQFWCEMMGIAMQKNVHMFTFWSVIEGNNTVYNMGYIDYTNGKKKPTYYHYKMMAENFSGSMISATDNQSSVKVFASKNANSISVLVMNQDLSQDHSYAIGLNSNAGNDNASLKINVGASVNSTYHDDVVSQSTQLLVFDLNGNLTKKIEYRLNGHADANLAPEVTMPGTVTGITKENIEKNLTVYPNPARSDFHIEVQGIEGFKENISFTLINQLGQTIMQKKIEPRNGRIDEHIEPAVDLSAGIYYVSLEVSDNTIVKKLLIRK